MKSQLDTNSTILAGADLRVLLNSDHISYGEINATLKEKGIYVGENEKSITVPILSATLLTPDNFSRLIEASVDRESQPKVKGSSLELVSDSLDWITPLKDSLFEDLSWLTSELGNISFVEAPEVIVDSSDSMRIPYKVTKSDYSKDWLQRELRFDGEITIRKKDGTLLLDFSTSHSSKETEVINKKITSNISKILNSARIVTSPEAHQIKFDSFNNEERIRFFKKLTAGFGKEISTGDVDNIEINIDSDGPPLPNDPQISWMKNSVKRMKIDGERLNDVFLISDEKYYKHYHIQKMDVEYSYLQGVNSGKCKICFLFSNTTRAEDDYKKSELTFSCVRLSHDNKVNPDSKRLISKLINESLKRLIDQKFQEIVSER
ncbi:GapS4b family protein [Pseudomonas aeruginosa]